MKDPFLTLFYVGAALLVLGLALRYNRNSGRPAHTVVIAYGSGLVGFALVASFLAAVVTG
ncbi:hypothetical protein [Streptomyces sp. NPDC051546]|uniref:hypothetical protein n=1 Tax=Streptomyces sp. NPDC051546 TaxID=3365655 RepID=UPI0037A1FDE2